MTFQEYCKEQRIAVRKAKVFRSLIEAKLFGTDADVCRVYTADTEVYSAEEVYKLEDEILLHLDQDNRRMVLDILDRVSKWTELPMDDLTLRREWVKKQ